MKRNTITTSTLYRSAPVARADVSDDDRTITLAYSSEAPVERYFGGERALEVLDHAASSVRRRRLADGAPLLLEHDTDRHIGVVEREEIGKDRVGRAVARLGDDPDADKAFRQVQQGIKRHVSVGYVIHRMVREQPKREGDLPVYRAVDWEPLEISLVAIPADHSVGVGRTAPAEHRTLIEDHTVNDDTKTETVEKTEQPKTEAPRAERVEPRIDINYERERARQEERGRQVELMAMGREYNHEELARAHCEKGTSVAEFRQVLLDALKKPKAIAPDRLDMPKHEGERWSLVKAVRAAMTGDWSEAGLEREVSQQVAKRLDRAPRNPSSFFFPVDIGGFKRVKPEMGRRDLTLASGAVGGNLKGTDHLGDEFIEALYASTIATQLGAQTMSGLVGDVAIPGLNATTTTYWVAENTAPTEGASTFRQVTMSPKTVAAYVDMGRRLLLQSSPSVETVIRNDLLRKVAIAVDDVAIEGGATNAPTGVLGTSGIGAVALGTNGAAPTWPSVINLIKEVDIDNALMGSLAFAGSPAARAKLMQTAKVSSTDSVMIMNDPDELVGYRFVASTNVPSDLTKGSGSALSALIFGNWSELMIGQWGSVEVMVDPYSLSTTGAVRMTIFLDVDIAVRHPQSFAAIKDMITN